MTFSDIFKKSFLEGYGGEIDIYSASVALLITCALALYIFFVYRVITRKTFYSKNFNISLLCVAVITSAIILTIQSNIVISLGMVGALSIVRFRTAIKDPMDLAFLFWSISIGIICGAGMAELAIILSLLLTAGVFLLNRFPVAKAPLLLVVNASAADAETAVMEELKKYAKYYKVKSRSITTDSLDIVVELRADKGGELVQNIAGIESITSASLLDHDGEATF